MGIGTARSAVFGLALAVTSFWAVAALGQPQPPVQGGASTTAEERQAAEKATLGDPRVRAILGAGQLRVAAGDVAVDKGEAEAFLTGKSERPPGKRVIVLVFNVQSKRRRARSSLCPNTACSQSSAHHLTTCPWSAKTPSKRWPSPRPIPLFAEPSATPWTATQSSNREARRESRLLRRCCRCGTRIGATPAAWIDASL